MIGELYINDKDCWVNFKTRLDDGFDNLLLPPNPKEYAENNLRSQPGKQVFVSNPQPEARDIQLVFAITCDSLSDYLTKYNSLVTELTGDIIFRVPVLKTVYKLRVVDFLNLSSGTGLRSGRLSVRFSEDNPKNRTKL